MGETTPLSVSIDPNAPVYKDRSTGLMIFGILTLLLGCLASLFVPLMIIGQTISVSHNQSGPSYAQLLPAMLIYLVLGVALIWLGIGSMLARRWARALLLIGSWSLLAVGIVIMLVMIFVLPTMMANLPAHGPNTHSPSPSALKAVMVFTLIFIGIFVVVLPAAWLLFYRSPHVKATCEARNPVPCWTDACPLLLLACSLWLAFAVPFLLVSPISGTAVMPFFGIFLNGLWGGIVCWVTAGVWSYAAWRIYKLDLRGWWVIVIGWGLFMVSGALSFARNDFFEVLKSMGNSPADMEPLRRTGLFSGNNMIWLSLVYFLPTMAYLIFIKRYFPSRRPTSVVTSPPA